MTTIGYTHGPLTLAPGQLHPDADRRRRYRHLVTHILLVVYTAFSSAVIGGLWQQVPPLKLLGVMFGCGLLLALALLIAHLLDKWLMSS
jgi:hypothetical protein